MATGNEYANSRGKVHYGKDFEDGKYLEES